MFFAFKSEKLVLIDNSKSKTANYLFNYESYSTIIFKLLFDLSVFEMDEEHAVDSGDNLSMPRYEEVREQILNHSFHDIQQTDLSAQLGVEV